MRKANLCVPILAAFAVACTQSSTSKAPAQTGRPQVAAPTSAPTSGPTGEDAPHALPEAGEPLSGTIAMAKGLEGEVKATDTLYIMARTHQGGGLAGRLVAVKRMTGLDASKFPARFELSKADTMVAGVPFKGPFVVYARLDRDGDPMTKTEQDLYATLPAPAENGAKDLTLELKKGMPKTLAAPKGPASQPASAPSH